MRSVACWSTLLIAVAAFAGCSGDPSSPVGSWTLNVGAMMENMKQDPDYQKQAKEGGEMAAKMIKEMEEAFKSMKMTIDIKSDNSFTATAEVMKEKHTLKGTWKLQGEKLTMTATEEDGKPKDTPDSKDFTFKDGKLSINEGGQKMVLTR